MQSHQSSLSQAEKLDLCSGKHEAVILAPETLGAPINAVTGQPVFCPTWERIGTPSRARAGVRPVVYASVEDETNEEEDDEESLRDAAAYKRRDSMREHSFRLPSQSNRRECLAEMKALCLSWES